MSFISQSNKTVLALAAVCLSAMAAGTGLSWTSPVLPQLDNLNGTLVSGNGTLYMDPNQRKSSHLLQIYIVRFTVLSDAAFR